jgi:acyl-CoA thioester hydrolase
VTDAFVIRIAVRGYELDSNGHVAGAVLLQYGQHARWELLRAAGVDQGELLAAGIGPVSLEERIRFHREVRAGDELDVSCSFAWGEGKTFRVEQELRRADGTLVAEVTNVGGLLDLARRRLLPDPAGRWRSAASAPEVLGLA